MTVPRGVRLSSPIAAIEALRDGGLSLAEAKASYETLVAKCELNLQLPTIADLPGFKALLADCGVTAIEAEHALV